MVALLQRRRLAESFRGRMAEWSITALWLAVLLLVGVRAGRAADPNDAPSEPRHVRIAGIVLKWVRGDKQANFDRAEPLIRQAALGGAQIVCTTECFLDGYAIADKSIPLAQYRALGEPIPQGPFFQRLAALADELDVHLVAGMLEADEGLRFNTTVVLGPDGGLVGKYRKQKLLHELVRNTPASESPVFETPYGKLGVIICADRTEPALVQRICARGADLIVCPSGGMYGPINNDPLLQARSRENGRTIVFVHPAEFLVTAPDGAKAMCEMVGDRLLVDRQAVDGPDDTRGVFYFDWALPPR